MKQWIAAFLITTLTGCGTIITIYNPPKASDNLAGWHSYCSQIPRVYSGFAYGYCTLNAPERYGVHDSAPIAAADMLLSGITDTLVLPYTIYQQNELGVVPVKRNQR
ncbi:YceK/YidQ family lipoprotein [Pseudomonas graminis]|uniref:YceK/YidQ family lipoprotein n=1 Tax=Pseudomonas graminis TaxID=158627 RepID=A0A1I0DQI0_9PSED|nr:YceK/YidQ family lipoprotein [Pseudomonas graminis]SET34441.1 Protein of unknown function [Pseudomonas graminis]